MRNGERRLELGLGFNFLGNIFGEMEADIRGCPHGSPGRAIQPNFLKKHLSKNDSHFISGEILSLVTP